MADKNVKRLGNYASGATCANVFKYELYKENNVFVEVSRLAKIDWGKSRFFNSVEDAVAYAKSFLG